jgi:hypothetical protein
MAKILFLTIYDPFSLGILSLAAYIRQFNHVAHCIFLRHYAAEKSNGDMPAGCFSVMRNGNVFLSNYDYASSVLTATEKNLLEKTIIRYEPDVIGISCRTRMERFIPCLIRCCRELKDIPIVCGGWGPSLNPLFYLRHGADLCIRGEGEEAMRILCERIDAEARGGKAGLRGIPNSASMREDGKVVYTPMSKPVSNLDELPLPIWNSGEVSLSWEEDNIGYTPQQYYSHNPYSLMTSRGCPAECSYCVNQAMRNFYRKNGVLFPKIRKRSLSSIMSELDYAKKTGARRIVFHDDFFIFSDRKLADFFEYYNAFIRLPFSANLHYEQFLRDNTLLKMATVYLESAYVGIQCGSEQFRAEEYNRKRKNSVTLEVINKVNSYFYPLTHSPIVVRHPEISPNPVNKSRWLYEALLMELRLVCDDATFTAIRADVRYMAHPVLLRAVLLMERQKKHEANLREAAWRLAGQDVYFYGCGAAYQRRKGLFRASRAIAVLCDAPYLPAGGGGGLCLRQSLAGYGRCGFHYCRLVVAKNGKYNI